VLAVAVAALKLVSLIAISGGSFNPLSISILAVITVVKELLSLMFWVLLLRAILSWVSQGQSPVDYVLYQLTEPFLAPIRRVIPPLGGLDLSVLIAIIALQFLQLLLQDTFRLY
jgi:YggT family protein